MSAIKKLAGQTAIYGLSSIVGRFLNYLLVPLYTFQFIPEQYGVVTELYAYAGFFAVLLTYGMETALFRFAQNSSEKNKVYSTALISLLATSVLFIVLTFVFLGPITSFLEYTSHPEFIIWFALILGFDAFVAIPFAKLRLDERPIKFATIRLINIGVNVGLNLFFILICKSAFDAGSDSFFAGLYDPQIGVGYVFISNLVASFVTFILLFTEIRFIRDGFDKAIWKKMFDYAWPLILVGFAGIINEMFDRMLLKKLLPSDVNALEQIGIYGAVYKLAMLITILIQAFRYAAEPFFFRNVSRDDAKPIYARVLRYFTIFCGLVFLVITLFIDLFKYFIPNEAYWVGLKVVPILLMANLFLGIYYNLSIWYKLTDRTKLGAAVALVGALITIILNIWWIPIYGYVGSAWATLICYAALCLLAYLFGQKYYPVDYKLPRLGFYILSAVGIFFLHLKLISVSDLSTFIVYAISSGLILLYVAMAYRVEKL